jgi:predicted nicotinamide N-methyase
LSLAGDRYTAFVHAETSIGFPSLVPEIALNLASEVTPLWHATEANMAESGLPPPFWAFAWPGGQALARLLLDEPERARGRRVLDFAAGCGIAGIAAAKSGASRVVASEIDLFAAAAIRINAAGNGVAIEIVPEDVLGIPPQGFDLILAGDLCYERAMAERVFAWLSAAFAAGAEVLLADPGRNYLPKVGLTELMRCDVPTLLDIENRAMMETVVYRVSAL